MSDDPRIYVIGDGSDAPDPDLAAFGAALVAALDGGPLTSWRATARALGVSVSTLERARAEAGYTGRPCFESPEEARSWYRALSRPRASTAPEPLAPLPRPRARPQRGTNSDLPVDWSKVKV